MTLTSKKPPRCKECGIRTDKPGRLLHEECVDAWWARVKAKQERDRKAKAKLERVDIRKRKEAIKPRTKWLAEAQAVVNSYVRIRDKNLACCSCDRPANWDGQWHASHFRSVGAASGVRFNLWNIHKGCSICNNHLSGNISGYRPRLLDKIGADKVGWLEAQNGVVRYEIDYLKRLKTVMGKRLKRLEKRA